MSTAIPSLTELFPDGNYEFHLTLRRTAPPEFFRPLDPSGDILRERARWLDADPSRYAALLPEGEPLLAEFARVAAGWIGSSGSSESASANGSMNASVPGGNSLADARSPNSIGAGGADGYARYTELLRVGRALEPDILFLSADPRGQFRLRGGALCFPTGWALEDKIGHTLDFIHGVVPGLNEALGSPIQQFLSKLKPGVAYLRHNWGLAATDELNLHPAREISAPALPVRFDQLWLRVEHQALLALPETRGIVFGIRIASHRLDKIAGGPASAGLRRALETMPAELAVYKRLAAIRADVIRLL